MIGTRPLGQTELSVSELGFGAGPLGNLYRPVTDSVAHEAVDAAFEAGLRYYDTAPYYGLGLSERRVGDALRGRDGVVLSTKVGRLLKPDQDLEGAAERFGFAKPLPFALIYDYSYDGIMRSVEDSSQRLGLARIDIALVHDIGRYTHGERDSETFAQLTSGGGYRALDSLRSSGWISAIGLGVNEVEICERCLDFAPFDCLMLAGRYTLLEQDPLQGLLARCVEAGTSILLGGPYNSGILATGTRGGAVAHFDYGPAPRDIIERVSRIEAVCDAHRVQLAAAALQFPLAHSAVASVVPGLSTASRVAQTVSLFEAKIPADFWQELKHEGLLHPEAPVPAGEVKG